MKKALVTGGAGFIGSHLSRRLLKEDWKVYIVDNLSTGYKENIPQGCEFIKVDLSSDNFVNVLPDLNFDAVFHLAAQSSGEISFDDPAYDLKTNCLSTVMLLKWCLDKSIKRFIYTSSMSIYGDQEIQPVTEDSLAHPKSFYGIGKLASEKYLEIYSRIGINVTSLRLFNVYGPGQNMENLRQGMVSIYMAYILKKQELPIKGPVDRYRDFIYIDDVVEAYMACLDRLSTFNKSYNVATGVRTTVNELVNELISVFGYSSSGYPIKYCAGTPGDTFGIYADISAIKRDVAWSPKVSLSEGIKRMSDWAKDHKQGDKK